MKFVDAAPIAGTRRTADGYLIADVKTARTGIYLYAGSEVGRPEMPVVRVYRSADQVFAKDALASYAHRPVTLEHPAEAVSAETWKREAVGAVGDEIARDGEFVRLSLSLMDADAIRAVESGKKELSPGYSCSLDWAPGVAPDGQAYDAQQKGIRINHVAVVDKARGGSECRIGDADRHVWGAAPILQTSDERTIAMSDALRTVVVDGLSVSTTDQGAQAIAKLQGDLKDSAAKIETLVADHAKAVAAKEAAHATALADKDKAIAGKDGDLAKKDAEIDALKVKVLSDADLDKRVQARGDLIATARAIAADVKTDGLSDAAIRKATVTAKLGDAAIKDKADAYIDARFDILAEDAAKRIGADPFRAAIGGGIRTSDAETDSVKAYQAMMARDAAAWQGKKEAA